MKLTGFFYLHHMGWNIEEFRARVEDQHDFPGIYIFKFIVPVEKKDQILSLLPEGRITFRKSSNNRYVSITAKSKLQTSQDVLDVYINANKVKGCIAL